MLKDFVDKRGNFHHMYGSLKFLILFLTVFPSSLFSDDVGFISQHKKNYLSQCIDKNIPSACYFFAVYFNETDERNLQGRLLALNTGCFISAVDLAIMDEKERKYSGLCCLERAKLLLSSRGYALEDARNSFWAACHNPENSKDQLSESCFNWGDVFENIEDKAVKTDPKIEKQKIYPMLQYSLQGFLDAYNDRGVAKACQRAMGVRNKIITKCSQDAGTMDCAGKDKNICSICDWAKTVSLTCPESFQVPCNSPTGDCQYGYINSPKMTPEILGKLYANGWVYRGIVNGCEMNIPVNSAVVEALLREGYLIKVPKRR